MSEVEKVRELVSEADSQRVHVVTAPDGAQAVIHKEGSELYELGSPKEGCRAHRFDDVASFAAWLNRHAEPDQCEVLVGQESISAALDPTSPIPEIVSCDLVKHPALEAWADVFGRGIGIRQFHDLARGYSEYLEAPDLVLTALRGFTVISSGDYKHHMDETGATRLVATSDKKEMTVKVPPELKLVVPIFAGVQKPAAGGTGEVEALYRLQLFVSLDLDKGATFALTCPGLPLVMKEARQDAADFLDRKLDDGFLIGLGTLDIGKRRQLPETSEDA